MQLPDLSLLLVMALFWATYAVLNAWVFKPLGGILEEREKASESATASLASALDKEKETLAEIDRQLTEARREAVAARQGARAKANLERQALLDAAREKSRASAAAAQEKLDREVAVARAELAKSARATAEEIAARALGRRIA